MTDGDYKELRAMPALAEKLNGKHAVWLTATDSSLILFHAKRPCGAGSLLSSYGILCRFAAVPQDPRCPNPDDGRI